MEPGQQALEDTTFAQRYALGEKLGSGGMGVVHRAHDRRLDRAVAIKLLRVALLDDPDAHARFLREARVAGAVNHPGVVRVYESGIANDVPFIVTEIVEGRPLSDVIAERGMLPREIWLPVALQVLEGIGAVHAAGIVHRDVKPANVLVIAGPPLVAKLTDFGVAKSLIEDATMDAEGALRTANGVLVGTPEYMSPEQLRAEPVSPASDLYALGLLYYRMITGQHAFAGTSLMEIARKQMLAEPPWPEVVEPPVRALLEKMLAKVAEDRPGIGAVRVALEALKRKRSTRLVAAGAPESVPRVSTATPTPAERVSTRSARLTLAAVILTSVATLFGVMMRRPGATWNTSDPDSPGAQLIRHFDNLKHDSKLRALTLAEVRTSANAHGIDAFLMAMIELALGTGLAGATPPQAPGQARWLLARLHETLTGPVPDHLAAARALDGWLGAAASAPASEAARLHPANAISWLREVLRVRDARDLDELLRGLRRLEIFVAVHPGCPLASLSHQLIAHIVPGHPPAAAQLGDTLLQRFLEDVIATVRARQNGPQLSRAWRTSAVILRAISQDAGVPWTERWEVPLRVPLDRLRRLQPQAVAAIQSEIPSGVLEASAPPSENAVTTLVTAFKADSAGAQTPVASQR